MTAEVISLVPRMVPEATIEEEDGPHVTGQALCGVCKAEWVAVAPIGQVHLECPKCHRYWGAFKHAIEPDVSWKCNCGEHLFWLTPTGAMCRQCGIRTTHWADTGPPPEAS